MFNIAQTCRRALAVATLLIGAAAAPALTADRVEIVIGENATTAERNIADLLAERLGEKTVVEVVVRPANATPGGAGPQFATAVS